MCSLNSITLNCTNNEIGKNGRLEVFIKANLAAQTTAHTLHSHNNSCKSMRAMKAQLSKWWKISKMNGWSWEARIENMGENDKLLHSFTINYINTTEREE